MLLFAYFRTARIDSFYNFQIVEQEEINISKKAKNKRDLILFLIVVGIIGLFFYLIYKICKKRFSKGPTSLIVKG
ncbi:hypothetical protein FACS189459_5760 [Bacilli bacterium]|nr:hypothetical protein FACS189459_5760 [Bacilli bacterium]